MHTPAKIKRHIQDENALFVISHSGGKDSQAMYLYLTRELGIPDHLVYVVHAILGGVDWAGSEEHIEATVNHPILYCQAKKTFMDMVRKRNADRPDIPSFPSPQYRQCTSDLKRDPINTVVRQLCEDTGIYNVVSCIGIRALESDKRALKNPFALNKRLTGNNRRKIYREVWDWYPIFKWTEDEVFGYIAASGQVPFWTYAEGMTRKSCKLCIMASAGDICTSSRLDPEHFEEMVALETEVGSTMFQGKTLAEFVANSNQRACEKECY